MSEMQQRAEARKPGRPSTYTDAAASAIIDRMMMDGEGLVAACRAVGVPKSTFKDWTLSRDDLAESYRQAQIIRALLMRDEIFEIVEDGRRDWIQTPRGPRINHAHIKRCIARINYRMWFCERFLPRRFGGNAPDDPRRRETDGRLPRRGWRGFRDHHHR